MGELISRRMSATCRWSWGAIRIRPSQSPTSVRGFSGDVAAMTAEWTWSGRTSESPVDDVAVWPGEIGIGIGSYKRHNIWMAW